MDQNVGKCVALFPDELADFTKNFPKTLPIPTVKLLGNEIFDILDQIRLLPATRLSLIHVPTNFENLEPPIVTVYTYLGQNRGKNISIHGFIEHHGEWYRIKTAIWVDGAPSDCYVYHIE